VISDIVRRDLGSEKLAIMYLTTEIGFV